MNDQINGVLYHVPSGKPLGIPKRHLAAFGITRDSGKTTFVESAVAASGMRAVVFRTKRGELGFENAKPLPLFFDERGLTHWKALEGLIAATLEEKINREPGIRYAIITVCTKPTQATSLSEIHQRVKDRLKDPKLKEFIKEVFTKLDAYLAEVLPQLEFLRGNFTNRLELPEPGVYVEDLEGLGVKTDELQNLFVASLIRKVYEELSGVIVVVAEIWKFLPQDRGSPVKWVIEKYVREMGVVEGWLWLDAQDLRGVDKKHLRSFDVRLFGRQPDPHEIDEVLKALPLPKNEKPKPEDIMTLKLGHFYAKLGNKVELVYVRPVWLPEEVAVRVARRELEPDSDEVQRFRPEPIHSHGDEEMYKAKCDELEKENERLKLQKGDLQKELAKSLSNAKPMSNILQEKEELEKKYSDLSGQYAKMADKFDEVSEERKRARTFKEALLNYLFPGGLPTLNAPNTSNTSKNVALDNQELSVTVQDQGPKEVQMTTEKNAGQLLFCAIELHRQGKQAFTSAELQKEAVEHGWKIGNPQMGGTLVYLVREGFLIQEGNSYRLPSKVKLNITKV